MSEKRSKPRGLGRGLSALMADVAPTENSAEDAGQKRADLTVPVEKIFPNPDQPRRTFTAEQLDELAASIKEKGIIQPLIVRDRPGRSGEYEIVAGERRWRAAQMAQLHSIPILVREFNDTEVLEVAIIENIQRADLNAVEEAAGYRQLMEKFGHTQEKLSEVLGKSRSYIANLVRLLNLPDEVQEFVREGKLSAGHARALITAEDPVALAKRVINGNLSVRETERLAKGPKESTLTSPKPAPKKAEKDADTRALEGDLSASLGMKVSIDHSAGQENGKVTISYNNLEQLDEVCRLLSSMR